MSHISAIGFDMDYTLAQYKPEFELLAYNGSKQKLVELMGYPKEILEFQYKNSISRRGCMIDRKRGNFLKLDQHRYVRAVEHGLTPLSKERRKNIYRESYQETETFASKDFINVDTPFSLVDAALYAQLVDLKDSCEERVDQTVASFLSKKSYSELWLDLRRCIEKCHKDGAIKLTVAQDPAKYIVYDDKCMMTAFIKKLLLRIYISLIPFLCFLLSQSVSPFESTATGRAQSVPVDKLFI